jgi:hypothetical protein
MKKILCILAIFTSSVYAVSYNQCPIVSDITCELMSINQEFCFVKGHKVMSPFWGGILTGEAPSKLTSPLLPSKLLSSQWSIFPQQPTTKTLDPLPETMGEINCYYQTSMPNVNIILLGGYAMPYANIHVASNWVSDKFNLVRAAQWIIENAPTLPQVLTKQFICRSDNAKDCTFTMNVDNSNINDAYKKVDDQ